MATQITISLHEFNTLKPYIGKRVRIVSTSSTNSSDRLNISKEATVLQKPSNGIYVIYRMDDGSTFEMTSYTYTVEIIEPKKLSKDLYAEMQEAWLRITGLKVGDKVKVVSVSDGVPSSEIGKIVKIVKIYETYLDITGGWGIRYKCLEPIEEESFSSLAELKEKHPYLGYQVGDIRGKYLILQTADKSIQPLTMLHGTGCPANYLSECLLSDFARGYYHIFDTERELYDWMLRD